MANPAEGQIGPTAPVVKAKAKCMAIALVR